ncbi:MAG TPA: class I SAM-dependent methyltransferase [Thermoanaerobaculia bacterium]|jgi:SAM-dependent methyltransferase|nr:class I SAM-dependent methyltransferase [Thermoanaerobaculia bacterium]
MTEDETSAHHESTAFNTYAGDLSAEQIASEWHRTWIGGLWEEMGRFQLDYLVGEGLTPNMTLLDVGCGCLRGGIHFIPYLETGRYYGIDVSAPLLDAGYDVELAAVGLQDRLPRENLLANGSFEAWRFGVTFDVALAQSVFTHLPANFIRRCLIELGKAIAPGGRFYATYFECPDLPADAIELRHEPGGIVSYLDHDPYHYRARDFDWLADGLPWGVEHVGDWGHPRDQRMVRFVRT